jgi:hypothetical protein
MGRVSQRRAAAAIAATLLVFLAPTRARGDADEVRRQLRAQAETIEAGLVYSIRSSAAISTR